MSDMYSVWVDFHEAELRRRDVVIDRQTVALIKIAAGFAHGIDAEGQISSNPCTIECQWCERTMAMGCWGWCPGLTARRALGVA